MPWVTRTVTEWVDDAEYEAQRRAARSGEMLAPEALEVLSCSRSRLNALVLSGVIRHECRAGRHYYDKGDVLELAAGGFPSDRHKLEAARAAELITPIFGESPGPATPAETGVDPLMQFLAMHAPEGRV